MKILTLSEMASDTAKLSTGGCDRCGCRDVRLLLAPDGRRFIGCRFCFRPRLEFIELPEVPKKQKGRK